MRLPYVLVLAALLLLLYALGCVFYSVRSPASHSGILKRRPLFTQSYHAPTIFVDTDRQHVHPVLLFVHIQKTAGTLLEQRLAWDGVQNRPCICSHGVTRCQCQTRGVTWLVSRYSTGWICGVHADLTEYSQCIDHKLDLLDERVVKRKFLYFTLLRNPIDRYLSEWLYMRDVAATWDSSKLRCNGKSAHSGWYRPCYTVAEFMSNISSSTNLTHSRTWSGVSLRNFLRCPFNLANNRQTRMLANLSSLGCYSDLAQWLKPSSYPYRLLSAAKQTLCLSAKHNLLGFFHAFGLSDHIVYTQYMLQRSLNILFNRPLIDMYHFTGANMTRAQNIIPHLTAAELRMVRYVNRLDEELYEFAKRLFILRFTVRIVHDTQIHSRFRRPLYTLWSRGNWPGLEYTLLPTKTLNKNSSFYFHFNCYLIRLFQRQTKSL